MEWYVRIAFGNPTQPGSYTHVGTTPPSCPGTGKICALLANDDGLGEPILDVPLLNQMILALSSDTDQPRVLLRFAD